MLLRNFNSQNLTNLKKKNSPDFYTWFKQVAKNIEGCFFIFYFQCLACSQIWLNILVDHCRFGYNTKSSHPPQKQKKQTLINNPTLRTLFVIPPSRHRRENPDTIKLTNFYGVHHHHHHPKIIVMYLLYHHRPIKSTHFLFSDDKRAGRLYGEHALVVQGTFFLTRGGYGCWPKTSGRQPPVLI